MPLKYFRKNKKLANNVFVCILLPYLLLCLTIGGFHDSIFKAQHCTHTQQSAFNIIDDTPIEIWADASEHNSETCQICQWLKTPSTLIRFLLPEIQLECVCTKFVRRSNPLLPSLSIHKFTIRPPPSFACFSV